MAFSPPKAAKPPTIQRKSVKSWMAGVVTDSDDARTPQDGLKSSGNTILQGDGVVRPRPSLKRYGPQPTGTILGEIFEFKKVTGNTSENWLITVQNVAGTARVYTARGEDTSWTLRTGKTYNTSADCHFCQIGDKVLVMNGEDNLSYFNISTNAVVPFTALTTPGAPTVANNGTTSLVSGGTPLTIYYRITANSTVGETIASTATSLAINTDRDLWNPSTQSLRITWSAVTSAVSYNVYMGTVSGFEYLIASGVNGLQYIDDGTAAQDPTRLYPTVDSTAGPKVSRGSVINGRVFLTGDKDFPYYVRYGGDFGNEIDFSPANGGGFSPVGNGTKEVPITVKPFRDGRGNSQVTVLCQGTNGRGKRYILTPDTIEFANTTISFFSVTEDNGQDGTDSPDGVILYNDSLWYPSRDGFKTTGTKPQLQNILSTDRVSNTIQRDIKSLNTSAMAGCVGLGFEGRLYWALPVASSTNNEIWVLDLDRKGAWMKPWNIAASWMTLYNDNNGTTHFLVLSDNVVYELTYSVFTSDDGEAFTTTGNSGIIKFSDDGREWGHIISVIFTFLRPQGTINVSVQGKTEDAALSSVGQNQYNPTTTVAGWSEPGQLKGFGARAWSKVGTVPASFSDASVDIEVEVDEECQWWQYAWNTTESGVDYLLSDVVVQYVSTGIKVN